MNFLFENGRVRLFPLISLLLAFGLLIITSFVLMVSPVRAAIFPTPTPAPDYIWSYVEVPKPAKMALVSSLENGTLLNQSASLTEIEPTQTMEPEPAVEATETPGQLAMDVLINTPVPVYVPPTEAPASAQQQVPAAQTYNSSKYILVDISEQHMYVYNGDSLLYSFVASTGMNNATAVGSFAVQSKIPSAYGSTWNIWMPNWLGIYWAGGLENGIHALPILPSGATLWEGYLGRPVSYGCVVLGSYESSLLYDWAEIGTTVEIRW